MRHNDFARDAQSTSTGQPHVPPTQTPRGTKANKPAKVSHGFASPEPPVLTSPLESKPPKGAGSLPVTRVKSIPFVRLPATATRLLDGTAIVCPTCKRSGQLDMRALPWTRGGDENWIWWNGKRWQCMREYSARLTMEIV